MRGQRTGLGQGVVKMGWVCAQKHRAQSRGVEAGKPEGDGAEPFTCLRVHADDTAEAAWGSLLHTGVGRAGDPRPEALKGSAEHTREASGTR